MDLGIAGMPAGKLRPREIVKAMKRKSASWSANVVAKRLAEI
jgi:hypothetical protein